MPGATLWGNEFLVNTVTADSQSAPTIAALANGQFVVAWTDTHANPDDPTGSGIRAQVFNADGSKAGADFPVNTTAVGAQKTPAIAALGDDHFVVAWGNDFNIIRAQVFNRDGTKSGPEIGMGASFPTEQPAVWALDPERFVVAWRGSGGVEIDAQIFHADGSAAGPQFTVRPPNGVLDQHPAITTMADGRFIITWRDDDNLLDDTQPVGSVVLAQIFNPDGSKSGDDFIVNTIGGFVQENPTIATLTNGRFVIAWEDRSGADHASAAVRAQMFNTDGTRFGLEFLVNTNAAGFQIEPAVTALDDGRFVIAWTDTLATLADADGGIHAQVFNSDGTRSGAEFLVNTTMASQQRAPATAALPDGRFVVSWTDNGEVRAQIFDARAHGIDVSGTTGADHYVGTDFADVLAGGHGDDHLAGAGGTDLLVGGAGDDTLAGGAGDDIYYVDSADDAIIEFDGGGNDTVNASASYTLPANVEKLILQEAGGAIDATGNGDDNILIGNSFANMLIGGAGNDTLDGGGGPDTLIGGTDDDTYIVDTAGDTVVELDGQGTDEVRATLASYTLAANIENLAGLLATGQTLAGNTLDNVITGGSGNDTLDGGGGIDALIGGTGDDVYVTDSDSDAITEASGGGVDEVRTSAAFYALGQNLENLSGTGVGQVLIGNGDDNTITAGAGNDSLDGRGGADRMIGGAGNDSYAIDNLGDLVVELAGGGSNDLVYVSISGYTLAAELESAQVDTTSGITLTGNELNNGLSGNDGNDTLFGADGNDAFNGYGGDDFLYGGAGDDFMVGDAIFGPGIGNDYLDGGTGADYMAGIDGNDIYIVDNIDDEPFEIADYGTDEVRTTLARYTLAANIENLTGLLATGQMLTGNSIANIITGGSSNDTLDGGGGIDTLIGGTGDDVYITDSDSDTITEASGGGIDEVRTSAAVWALGQNLENLTGTGTSQALIGNGDDNTITAGAGNDSLDGRGGADRMIGGAGNDSYAIDNPADVVVELAGGGSNDLVYVSISGYTLAAGVESAQVNTSNGTMLTGNELHNRMFGNLGNDTLNGAGGNDLLAGNDGNDTLNGGDNNDTLYGDAEIGLYQGDDLLFGGDGDDFMVGDTVYGVSIGNDYLDGGTGADYMAGINGDDIYIVDNAADQPYEIANFGTDEVRTTLASYTLAANIENLSGLLATGQTLIGNTLGNVVTGGAGDDRLSGDGGDDTLSGGDGIDTADYSGEAGSGDVIVNLTGAAVTIAAVTIADNRARDRFGNSDTLVSIEHAIGAAGSDTLLGGAGDNRLEGRAGNDTLDGGADHDTLIGGAGDDDLTGGDGTDLAVFSGARADYSVELLGNGDIRITDLRAGGPDGIDTVRSAESFAFSDGTLTHATLTNRAPVIGGGGDSASFVIPENIAAVATITASDPDAGTTLAWSISGGADAARFLIDSATGAVAFIAAPDFESPADADHDNSYIVQVRASDGSLFDDQTIVVSVGNVDEQTVLAGTPGNDVFAALAGDERLDAGPGIDTIAFNFRLADAAVTWSGNQVIVDGPAGSHTVLTGFETYVFADGIVNNNDGDPLVDDLFYYTRNHDVWNAQVEAEQHYHQHGWREGRNPNAFFDTQFYLSVYRDVSAAGLDPLVQYHQQGWKDGRAPSLEFSGERYLAANPDVALAGIDPLWHFLHTGAQEGRQPLATTALLAANGFDYAHYLQHNPDVAAAQVDPLWHFETVGWKEGRNPNALFDVNGYLAVYTDVQAAGINPLDHYHQSGWREGRDPSPGFDTTDYLAHNTDVAAADVDPLWHYLQSGIHEGRSPLADGIWG